MSVGEAVLLRLPKDDLSGEGTVTAIDPAPFVPGGDEPLGMMFVAGKKGGQGKGTIETMEVGDYVTTYTHEERRDRLPIDDTQGKWVPRQRIRLHLDKEDGGHSSIVFLRDTRWVQTEKAAVGGTVYLNMPDMGCVGHARVTAVEPCMVFLRWGNSSIRMVTGTFAHSEGWCGDLKLKGESKPLGVTALHPIWSEDRQDWVSAGELRPGETVKTIKGTTTVESYTMCDKPEPVFNMEVEGDHVYRVGEQGILVHNASDACSQNKVTTPGPGGAAYSTVKINLEWPDGVERDYLVTHQVVALVEPSEEGKLASDAIIALYRNPVRFIRPRPDKSAVPPAGCRMDWLGHMDKTDHSGHIVPRIAGGRASVETTENSFPQGGKEKGYAEFTEWLKKELGKMKVQQTKPNPRDPAACRICVRWNFDFNDKSYPFRPSNIAVEAWRDSDDVRKWTDMNE